MMTIANVLTTRTVSNFSNFTDPYELIPKATLGAGNWPVLELEVIVDEFRTNMK